MERNEKVYQVIIASETNGRMYDHFEFLARVNVNADPNVRMMIQQIVGGYDECSL